MLKALFQLYVFSFSAESQQKANNRSWKLLHCTSSKCKLLLSCKPLK